MPGGFSCHHPGSVGVQGRATIGRKSSKTDAIEYGIIPALGDFVDDFDVDEIFERYYDVYVPCNEDGVQVGNVEIVPRWTLEHPEWEDQDGTDLFWEVVQECEIERGRDANGD